jgi:ubiquinone biosynthesis protein UbiJ
MQHFILEQAINHLITKKKISLKKLKSKTIFLSLEGSYLSAIFYCNNNRMFALKDAADKADVDISLKPLVFLELLKGENITQLLKKDKISISGDIKTAQLFFELLKQLDTDPEQLVDYFTGDVINSQFCKTAKELKNNLTSCNSPVENIKDGLTTLFVAPSKLHIFKQKRT